MKMTGAVLALLGITMLAGARDVRAQTSERQTTVTFGHPVQVPGQILPPGTYIFTISESVGIRNVVGIWDKDHTKLITNVITIANQRLKYGSETVIEFHEAPPGAPKALKAWFYPKSKRGLEFVYSKGMATQLAQANNEEVPAAASEPTPSTLTTVPLQAITAQGKEEPIDQAFPAKAAK